MNRILTYLTLVSCIFISCKRDVLDKPPKDRTSLLTEHVWQIAHIYSLQDNTVFFYERGGQNNTYDYSNDFIKFEKGGSGSYSAGNDTYQIAWKFDTPDQTEITYTIQDYADGHPQNGINLDVKLENIFLSSDSFRYAEIYTNNNGTHSVGSVYRSPKTGGN